MSPFGDQLFAAAAIISLHVVRSRTGVGFHITYLPYIVGLINLHSSYFVMQMLRTLGVSCHCHLAQRVHQVAARSRGPFPCHWPGFHPVFRTLENPMSHDAAIVPVCSDRVTGPSALQDPHAHSSHPRAHLSISTSCTTTHHNTLLPRSRSIVTFRYNQPKNEARKRSTTEIRL